VSFARGFSCVECGRKGARARKEDRSGGAGGAGRCVRRQAGLTGFSRVPRPRFLTGAAARGVSSLVQMPYWSWIVSSVIESDCDEITREVLTCIDPV
jgi:hypothetical protein